MGKVSDDPCFSASGEVCMCAINGTDTQHNASTLVYNARCISKQDEEVDYYTVAFANLPCKAW